MKLKKKTAMILSFTLGTMLFATTALADIANKSGYDQLKDGLKAAAENCSEKYDSFTMDISFELKDNGKTIISENQILKNDRTQNANISISSNKDLNGNDYGSTSYSDNNMIIRWGPDGNYYVTEFTQKRNNQSFDNPFKEKEAEDIEKIADAVVGSLKDHVMVTENADGSKKLYGTLSEVQIPSLVNAVASFQLKQEFSGVREGISRLAEDIYVKEVTGTALINKEGVLENILGSAVLSGKDEQGNVHEITVEVLGKLTGINSTVVSKPDLTGKNVIKEVVDTTKVGPATQMSNPEKFVGQFKNDIIIEKDGKFVKIGERILDITHVDNTIVTGSYREEYKKGFEEYAAPNNDFDFKATFHNDARNAELEYTNEAGIKQQGNLYFDEHLGKVYFNLKYGLKKGNAFHDSTFSPDFE